MNINVLGLYNRFKAMPLGKHLFSAAFCLQAPYFMNIYPVVNDLRPVSYPAVSIQRPCTDRNMAACLPPSSSFLRCSQGYANVSMNQRWSVQNHIKTVHAIAVCNLVEMSMGLIAEATLPKHLRWLPMGMDVTYTKKALGRLTAESTIDPETFFKLDKYPGQVSLSAGTTCNLIDHPPTQPPIIVHTCHQVGVPVVVKDASDVVVTTATVSLSSRLIRKTNQSLVCTGALVDIGEAHKKIDVDFSIKQPSRVTYIHASV